MKHSKGFTLAELLIVVAIIAVLVAVAIPVFSGQLERAREAVDVAHIREFYSEVMTYKLTNPQETRTRFAKKVKLHNTPGSGAISENAIASLESLGLYPAEGNWTKQGTWDTFFKWKPSRNVDKVYLLIDVKFDPPWFSATEYANLGIEDSNSTTYVYLGEY